MAAHLLWRDGRLAAAGFNRRTPRLRRSATAPSAWCAATSPCSSALIVAWPIYAALGGDLEALGEADDENGGRRPSAASLAVAYVIAITAGITEEIVFRAYAITRLEELGWGRGPLSSCRGVVFTSLHLYQGLLALVVIGGDHRASSPGSSGGSARSGR